MPRLPSMSCVAHPDDRLNVLRALSAPFLFFAPFVLGFPEGYQSATTILVFLAIGKTNYILHLHVHRPFSNSAGLNLLLDLSMGAVTGMTSSNWRIQHVHGHHRRIDRPYRARERWELETYSPLRAVSFSCRSIWRTFWAPYQEAIRKGLLMNVKTPIDYRWAACEQTLLVLLVALLLAWRPWLVLSYLLPLYVLTYFISRYVDYLNHYGCEDRGEKPFACANNSLNRWFNSTTHNFGYHTAHHLRPGAHWTELPEIHRRIAGQIPERHLKPFGWSFLLMPYHVYRSFSARM